MEFVVRARLGTFQPNADVVVDEEARRVVVVVEVAGAEPESLRIGLDERYLVVAGRRGEVARSRHGSFLQKEIVHGEFVKRIPLPVAVEYEGVAASYEDGLLIVVAPIATTAYLPTARTELHVLVKRTHS
ncbi:MAG TPA: Hsp20/alpha crystallin family protein [Candidatus Dormibacteraeota bacterium]|nr:Hsp20/alpha crystallin family protein [Candidatus Dormibacteraeota bacterium]